MGRKKKIQPDQSPGVLRKKNLEQLRSKYPVSELDSTPRAHQRLEGKSLDQGLDDLYRHFTGLENAGTSQDVADNAGVGAVAIIEIQSTVNALREQFASEDSLLEVRFVVELIDQLAMNFLDLALACYFAGLHENRKPIATGRRQTEGAQTGGQGKSTAYQKLVPQMKSEVERLQQKNPKWSWTAITDKAAESILVTDARGDEKPISGKTIRNHLAKPKIPGK